MKKAVLVLTIVLVLVGVFAVSALTQVEIDRDISATVESDTDENVAVKFEVNEMYDSVGKVENGVISFDLGGALVGDAEHYNVEAKFTIGDDDENWVFRITNNSQFDISVAVNPDDGPVMLVGEDTVETGETEKFYFMLDTSGLSPGAKVEATLEIREDV